MREQRKKRNRWICMLLAVILIVTMMPAAVFAEEGSSESVVSETGMELVTEEYNAAAEQTGETTLENDESATEMDQVSEEQDSDVRVSQNSEVDETDAADDNEGTIESETEQGVLPEEASEETVISSRANENEGQIEVTLNANNDKAYFVDYNQETGQEERVAEIETWVSAGENIGYIGMPSYSEEDGIYFKGWSKSIDGDILEDDYKPEEGETFYAQWGKTAKYTFVANNELAYYEGEWNSETEESEHVQEKAVWEPEENTWIWNYTPKYNKEDGIVFAGWAESVDGPCVVSQYGDPEGRYKPKAGATYYAQWKKTTKITLDPNNEDAYFHYYNDQYEYEDSPTKNVWIQEGDCMYSDACKYELKYDKSKGKVFIGWSTEKDGEVIEDGFVPEDGTIFYGQWGDGAKITFHANREDASFYMDPDLFEYIDSSEIEVYVPVGKPVEFLGNWDPSYEIDDEDIYLFGGWSLKPDGDLIDERSFIVTEPTDLYAKWVRGYSVMFDAGEHGYLDYAEGDYNTITNAYYEDGELLDISEADPPCSYDDQYAFTGWYLDKDLTQKVPDGGINVTRNMTIYAGFFKNSDINAANEVISKINALPASAGVSNETAVKAARAAYNGLTAEQKKLVSQAVLSKLSSAETQVANAKNQTNSGSQSGEKKADGQKQAAYNKAVSKAKALKVTKPKTKAAKKKKAKVSWSAAKGASGYEIQYGLKKNFKKAKTVTANGTAKKATLKKLKVGKKYFVRIRPFTNVINVNGKTEKVYGAWSKTMKIKAKK